MGFVAKYFVPEVVRRTGLVDCLSSLSAEFGEFRPATQDSAPPIFIFSGGWRSGSTMVQRLICSDPGVLVWGEPFGDHVPIPRMASMFYGMDSNVLHRTAAIDNFEGALHEQWIANLNPGIGELRLAHRATIDQLLGTTAEQRGFHRWGAKWVRLTADHAAYLRWLYPHAKLVFLVRHVLSSYRSYKKKKWYTVKPEFMTRGVAKFASHWSILTASFMKHANTLNAKLVRYEDLIEGGQTLEELESFLEVKINHDMLSKKIGSRQRPDLKITSWDRLVCQIVARKEMAKLGYKIDGTTVARDDLKS